ncbi:MAG: hypothetical protein K6G16_01990 [Lachnospiraceae bacterium]|nr:hypothetical protein [Lachnospiraceae bacterium]
MANSGEEQAIRRDRLRFTKNKSAANCAILAIVFDVLYFISIYKSDAGSWYYSLLIGMSVVYNLIFMLVAFLVSEGSKNYLVQYSYVIAVVGILQFVRIGILPARAHAAVLETAEGMVPVMGDAQFARVAFYLAASGICCLASAFLGVTKCRQLAEAEKAAAMTVSNSEITS